MKNMNLEQIAHAVNGQLFCGKEDKNKEAKGVVIDNRIIEKDYVFVATKGERVNAHSFVNNAFEKGSLAAIVEEEGDYKGPYILVEDSFDALRDLAKYYRESLDIPVVGIIGSVGKTSTKEMVSSVLSEKYNVLKTKGNLNNDIGLPLTILSIKEEHTAAVVEMGISMFGEMQVLAKIASPNIVVFTNIGECHLENLKTRDGILKEKTEVLKYLSNDAIVVINNDDDKLSTIEKNDKNVKYITYGITEEADVKAVDVENLGLEGIKANVNQIGEYMINLPGEHNVYNSLAAISVGLSLGETKEEIVRGIAKASTISGRSNFVEKDGVTIIDDCYNANPVSMKASLKVLGMWQGRKIAVLGDMGELGENEVDLHSSVSIAVDDNNIDILYTVGPLAENIGLNVKGDCAVKSFVGDEATKNMIEDLKKEIKKGDAVLIKASHFMKFSEVVDELSNYLEA